jgi:hypothetical protein
MSAVVTTLDFSAANGMRARRRASERNARGKLSILRRIERQFVLGTLPRATESNVEQSWNEQVFAAVLGYRTQFSHDQLPFHLKAKNYQSGYFSDFSLGFFSATNERVLVSAELKGPVASLDAPQGAKYEHMTPVEQAFRTGRSEPECRWVLLSNFVEVRLYTMEDDRTPLVRASLREITDSIDLALLRGVLDQQALLGDALHAPELSTMANLTDDHPASPVAPADDEYRFVMRFTPAEEQEVPLFLAEQGLRKAIVAAPNWPRLFQPRDYGLGVYLACHLRDGWVSIDGQSAQSGVVGRVAMSLLGQVQASFRFKSPPIRHDDVHRRQVEFEWLLAGLRFFGGLLGSLYPMTTIRGLWAAEIREARDKFMDVPHQLLANGGQNSGVAESNDVLAGDFLWDGGRDALEAFEAKCACELAAYFRSPSGGIEADLAKTQAYMPSLDITATVGPTR